MGFLRRIESRLEGVFEGGIGRTFRSHVQPVELARKLTKEMDDNKVISVQQVYVPNAYTVFLAPDDREQFLAYEARLRTELAGYLTEHARREGYSLPGRARVMIETADELEVGTFGIAAEMEETPPPVAMDSPPAAESLPAEFGGGAVPPAETAPPVAPVVPIPPVAPIIDPFAVDAADEFAPAAPTPQAAPVPPVVPAAPVIAAAAVAATLHSRPSAASSGPCPLPHRSNMATAMVWELGPESSTGRDRTRVASRKMKSQPAISEGESSGTTTRRKPVTDVAPETAAASSSSRCTCNMPAKE